MENHEASNQKGANAPTSQTEDRIKKAFSAAYRNNGGALGILTGMYLVKGVSRSVKDFSDSIGDISRIAVSGKKQRDTDAESEPFDHIIHSGFAGQYFTETVPDSDDSNIAQVKQEPDRLYRVWVFDYDKIPRGVTRKVRGATFGSTGKDHEYASLFDLVFTREQQALMIDDSRRTKNAMLTGILAVLFLMVLESFGPHRAIMIPMASCLAYLGWAAFARQLHIQSIVEKRTLTPADFIKENGLKEAIIATLKWKKEQRGETNAN